MPMLLILPAFSSPDLKAFPLHLRHYRSSGSAPSLPNLPRACRARLCLPCQPSSSRLFASPYRRQTLQPQTRHPSHQRWYVLLLSYSKCQWRKDPHLPFQPLSVRHLPRTTSLPPVAFVASLRICLRRRVNHPQTPQAKND